MSISENYRGYTRKLVFDGNEYPYWKHSMCLHIKGVNSKSWRIMSEGFHTPEPGELTHEDRRIFTSMLKLKTSSMIATEKVKFGRVGNVETVKKNMGYSSRSMKVFSS